MSSDSGAPPLGQRPSEPMPGKQSLADPFGRAQGDGDGGDKGTCPDCGLPFGEHPEFGHARRDSDDSGMDLPGKRLEPTELGGDPAES